MGEARVDGGAVGELNDFISKIDASRRGFFTNCPTNNNLNATAEFITYLHRYSGHSTMSNFVSLTANFTSKIPWGMYEMYKDRLPNPPQIRNMHAEFKIILMKPYVKDTHKRMGYTCCSKSGGSSGGSGGTVPSTPPKTEVPCSDAKCPICDGCLAGIGGRALTKSVVSHKKCTCPVLCFMCGETQINQTTKKPKCIIPKKVILVPKLEAYSKMWLISSEASKEISGFILDNGFIQFNSDLSNNSYLKSYPPATVDFCGICGEAANNYAYTTSETRVKIISTIHTHIHIDVANLDLKNLTHNIAGISSQDSININTYGVAYGTLLLKNIVVEYKFSPRLVKYIGAF